MKRTSATFKSQIFDGSQCNASFKENGFLGNGLLGGALQTSNENGEAADTDQQEQL